MKTIVNYAQKVKEQHALNKTLAPVETDLTDASRSYAIGEQFINDGDLFKAKTAIAQHDALVLDTNYEAADDITTQIKNKTVTTDPVPTEGSTNPVQSNGVFVENRNIYEVMGEMGAKNLIPYPHDAKTETKAGITFTENADGSITVNGTATDTARHLVTSKQFKAGEKYILSGCPSGGAHSSNGTYTLYTQAINNYDDGEGVEFTWNASITGITIAVFTGVTVDNLTFYPMLRLASDTDNTFQPYAKTNQQLTAENEALTNKLNNEIVTRSELGAKNLLPYDIQKIKALNTAGTWNGNTYTPNNSSLNITLNTDGSITVDGTSASAATATLYIYGSASEANENIFKGMIASGCPSGGATNKYSLAIQGFSTTTPSGGNNYHDIGEGITVGNDNYVRVYVRIQNNTTVSNLTFKPMIRLASDPDATYQPYAKTNQELTAENQTLTNNLDDEVSARAELGAHQLLDVNDNSNPINVAIANNGIVSTNTDTRAANIWVKCYKGNTAVGDILISEDLTVGKFKRTFTIPSNYDFDTLWIGHNGATRDLKAKIAFNKTGSFKFICNVTGADTSVSGGYVLENILICLATDNDETWQPYAMTNRELTVIASRNGLYIEDTTSTSMLDMIENIFNTTKNLMTKIGDAVIGDYLWSQHDFYAFSVSRYAVSATGGLVAILYDRQGHIYTAKIIDNVVAAYSFTGTVIS